MALHAGTMLSDCGALPTQESQLRIIVISKIYNNNRLRMILLNGNGSTTFLKRSVRKWIKFVCVYWAVLSLSLFTYYLLPQCKKISLAAYFVQVASCVTAMKKSPAGQHFLLRSPDHQSNFHSSEGVPSSGPVSSSYNTAMPPTHWT